MIPLFTNRPEPPAAPNFYQSYDVSRPLSTHTRIATCQEVGCKAYKYGWVTLIDTSSDLGAKQANYIRLHSGRHYTIEGVEPIIRFIFSPEQKCFSEHRLRIRNDPILRVIAGDYRHTFGLIRRHTSMESFVDDLHESTERVRERIERG